MKNVKKIRFVFENCEYVELEAKYFGCFVVTDIEESVKRTSLNSIMQTKTANKVAFEIFKDAKNIEYTPFGNEKYKTDVLSRLAEGSDITQLKLKYDDNSSDTLFVDWNNENEFSNSYQKQHIDDYGTLYIVISKECDVFDYFNKDSMSDTEYQKWKRKMIFKN